MNLHLPQSIAAETELENLASVLRLIISPRENAPIIQMVQDTLTGAFRISNPKISIPEHVAMNLVGRLKRAVSSFVRTNENHTGMDVISSAFPLMNFNENVTIKNGKLVKGLLKKGAFNTPSKGVLHVLYNDFGPERCGQFINEVQSIVTKFNMFTGFSTGSSDLVSNQETSAFVAETLAEGRRRVQEILTDVHAGRFVNISGRSDGDELENQINNTLKDISAKISSRVMESLPKDNRLVQMVDAGAKGSDLNITQMIALLGQQIIDGKRVQFTLQDRTLPHFTKFDDGIESRGFVESSFVHGLRPAEFFYHAMGGREGLIDTAVKSVTGDTEIVIIEDGVSKHTTIGDWIDRKLEINSDAVKNIENNNMEYLELDEAVCIPTVDTNGNMTWGEVTAVTRHDPGKVLYQIRTLGGREVIVTESQSLIVWDESVKQFIPKITPEVTTDDHVPVCAILPEPPTINTHIVVSRYLPKTEYLYGTDFEVAVREMKLAMKDRFHIPSGWWNSNNGTLFTLPYDSKARLARTIIRSNISNIQSGFIYPFTTNREHARIPDMIELNESNGIMFGLYLAEGNIDESAGSLTITNNNENVRMFAKNWFDSCGIVSCERARTNHIGGTTTTITGYSVILVNLFKKLMGCGAANKHVPNEAFGAPTEFIVGLLNGYFSGDGHVDHNSINASSASSRLIQGINMLCNRLGVFGKIFTTQMKSNNLGTENILPAHRMTIRAQWATMFASKVWLVDNIKNDALKRLSAARNHKNFQAVRDVVMDKIIEINQIEPDNYPKMYDLTIPSTLNFGLANGLQVRDTSDTGYIQRRMMKTMEDMHVEYDATVRNNQGQVIQYRYGEDGIDSICVESQPIDLALLPLEEIYRRYALNVDELVPILTETITEAPDLVDEIIRDREMLVHDVFAYTNTDSLLAPVHLKRLTDRYRNQYSTKTDLTPAHVVDELSKLIKEPYMISNKVFHALLRFYLAPRRCIIEYRFSKEIFDEVLREIRFRYIKSRVHSGEMVGALAAQSIGEPTTQLTLNSVDWDEEIIISKNGNLIISSIGEFVDTMMKMNTPMKLENDQLYLELHDGNDWKALSCDASGNMTWTTLEAITSHPVVNEDGSDTILEVSLQSGRSVKATKGKSFLTVVDGQLTATNGSDLTVGSELPIAISTSSSSLPVVSEFKLRTILSPREYLYGTDVESALECMKTDRLWWSNHQGKKFTLPYSRGDGFRDAFVNGKNKHDIRSGFVYTKHQSCEPSQIPDTFELSKDVGFFVGAYLAEGSSNRNQVNITNNNIDYLNRVRDLMDMWEVGTHIVSTHKTIEKTGISGTSQSLIIHSTILAKVLSTLFGRRSYEKTLPDWCLQAPLVFQQGIVDGYISGDGCVHTDGSITFTSVSKDLIERMNLLFAAHGIFTRIASRLPENTRFQTVRKYYTSTIPQYYAQVFASKFSLTDQKKQGRMILRDRKFKRTVMNDVVLDKVVSINEVRPIKGRVYDLTVQGTRNFMTKSLINMRDTFHSAGTVKAGATQGVPRIQELLSVSRNPKNPLNYVYLNPTIAENEDQAIMMMREIQKTTLRDITKSIRIYYDPFPLSTESVVQEDREILEMFQAFSVGKTECASPWVMRLEFDRIEMASRNVIDMVAVQDAISNNLPILQCVYTDTNADKLIMRIVFPTSVSNLLALRFYEETILDVVIGGVEGVGRVYRREVKNELIWDDTSNVYACRKQYVLDVEGTNLFDLLRFHDVDNTRTFSNDIHEVLEVFGIEAARQALYDEFSEVFAAAYVNYHHMSVLLDSMTYQGRLVSVDRFGMNKHDNGVLAKSSFEETSKILFNAAVSAEFDAMKGVSANIMFGQKPPCGTGLVDILLDETKLPDGEEEMYVDYREQVKLRVQESKKEEETGECKIEDITMW